MLDFMFDIKKLSFSWIGIPLSLQNIFFFFTILIIALANVSLFKFVFEHYLLPMKKKN